MHISPQLPTLPPCPIIKVSMRPIILSLQVVRAGKTIKLTKREYDLLEVLTRNAGRVLTKDCIFEQVWGYDSSTGWESIKVYIQYLRNKLNAEGKTNLIHAVRGVGYVLHA
jgi:two-component system response regulator MprA